jgi:hypothetical protein
MIVKDFFRLSNFIEEKIGDVYFNYIENEVSESSSSIN